MIFQDPYSTLNPARTIDATLREAIAAGPDSEMLVDGLLDRVGLPAFMRNASQRRSRAVSASASRSLARSRCTRDLLVCDEATSALDVSVQAAVLDLLVELRTELHLAMLFITHDLGVVATIADRVLVLFQGEVESGHVDVVLDAPSHPYTRRLVESVPRDEPGWLAGAEISG